MTGLCRRRRRLAQRREDVVDHPADQPLVVAFGHDADHAFGSGFADDKPALVLGSGSHKYECIHDWLMPPVADASARTGAEPVPVAKANALAEFPRIVVRDDE